MEFDTGLLLEIAKFSENAGVGQASPSQRHIANRHRRAFRRNIDVAMRRRLHGLDEGRASLIALEATEFVGADDDNFLTAMNRDVLRSVASGAAHNFTEAGSGILQTPPSRTSVGCDPLRPGGLDRLWFFDSGHADQNSRRPSRIALLLMVAAKP